MKRIMFFVLLTAFVLVGCAEAGPVDPVPQSDNRSASFQRKSGDEWVTTPVDENIYRITGEVVSDIDSLTRQVSPAYGSYGGSALAASGYYVGPVVDGKSFVRVLIKSINPYADGADIGSVVILKVLDTKAQALLPGDTLEFKCRRQYEAVAPVVKGEVFEAEKYETWEFDYCRLVTGELNITP